MLNRARCLTNVAADKHLWMRLRRNGDSMLAAELGRYPAMNIMNPTEMDRARRAGQWQLWIGWATAAAMLGARLVTVVLQLNRGRLDPVDFGLAIFKSALLIAV